MARQFSTGTKLRSEKGKAQNPARIPPQTPPAGGKKAEAGQFHSPRKIVCPAEPELVFRIFLKISSNFVQKIPPNTKPSLVDGFFWLRWWGTSRTPLDSTSKHRLRRMPKAVPNEMRDEVFADATRKPNNPPLNKSKGHPHGCPFHFIALRFKTIAKLNPLALLLATSEPP